MTTHQQSEIIDLAPDLKRVMKRLAEDRKRRNGIELLTPGNVKSEMGRTYRAYIAGELLPDDAQRRIVMLRQILVAMELELKFSLSQDDEADDRPVFTGLTIIAPAEQ